jgi:hypothetical protein
MAVRFRPRAPSSRRPGRSARQWAANPRRSVRFRRPSPHVGLQHEGVRLPCKQSGAGSSPVGSTIFGLPRECGRWSPTPAAAGSTPARPTIYRLAGVNARLLNGTWAVRVRPGRPPMLRRRPTGRTRDSDSRNARSTRAAVASFGPWQNRRCPGFLNRNMCVRIAPGRPACDVRG